MRKGLVVSVLAVSMVLLSVVPSSARDGDVRKSGSCSSGSSWKLKLSPDNGRIEVEFEVDQNQNGQDWRVVMKNDGDVFFRGTRTTQAPSGSFQVRKFTDNGAGDDRIVARAVNVNSDEVCKGAASI